MSKYVGGGDQGFYLRVDPASGLPYCYSVWSRMNAPNLFDGAGSDPDRVCGFLGLQATEFSRRQMLRTCTDISQCWGFGTTVLTWLYARAGQDVKDCAGTSLAEEPYVGDECDRAILEVGKYCDKLVACWGDAGMRLRRPNLVKEELWEHEDVALCHMGLTNSLQPRTPRSVAKCPGVSPHRWLPPVRLLNNVGDDHLTYQAYQFEKGVFSGDGGAIMAYADWISDLLASRGDRSQFAIRFLKTLLACPNLRPRKNEKDSKYVSHYLHRQLIGDHLFSRLSFRSNAYVAFYPSAAAAYEELYRAWLRVPERVKRELERGNISTKGES